MVKGRKIKRRLTMEKERTRNLLGREVATVRGGIPLSETDCDLCNTNDRTGGDTCSCDPCADFRQV